MSKRLAFHLLSSCDIGAVEKIIIERDQLKHAVSDFIKKANVTVVDGYVSILWEALEDLPEYKKLVECCDE